jgi:hypothetical protein
MDASLAPFRLFGAFMLAVLSVLRYRPRSLLLEKSMTSKLTACMLLALASTTLAFADGDEIRLVGGDVLRGPAPRQRGPQFLGIGGPADRGHVELADHVLRRPARRERRPELDPNDPALVPEAPAAADSALEALEHETVLREVIATLPDEQARLLRICYYEDKSHRQIARELDIPLGTVKSRLRLALARLRISLQDRV